MHNLEKKIKFNTENHHIIPKCINMNFSNFIDNSWNKSILLIDRHIEAHALIVEAINHQGLEYTNYFMNYNINRETLYKQNSIDMKYLWSKRTLEEKRKIILKGISNRCPIKWEKGIKQNLISRNKKYINEEGISTSSEIESRKKQISTKELNSRKFNLYHIDMGLISENILRKENIKISQGLLKSDKYKYLGSNKNSMFNLTKASKNNLQGLYI